MYLLLCTIPLKRYLSFMLHGAEQNGAGLMCAKKYQYQIHFPFPMTMGKFLPVKSKIPLIPTQFFYSAAADKIRPYFRILAYCFENDTVSVVFIMTDTYDRKNASPFFSPTQERKPLMMTERLTSESIVCRLRYRVGTST